MAFNVKTGIELKDHILRRLGAPVINIEVTEDQVYDCISRAIELFVEYHYDGVDKTYIVRKLSAAEASTGIITFDEPVLGISKVESTQNNILDQYSGSAVVTDWIYGLINHTDTGKSYGYGGGIGIGTQFDMVSWQLMSSNLETLKNLVTPNTSYHYNGMNRQLKLFDEFLEGQIVFLECYVETAVSVSDAAGAGGGNIANFAGAGGATYQQYPLIAGGVGSEQLQNVYNVRWVKDMSTAYVKYQWGSNLKKYGNQQLAGGVTVEGQTIYDEAVTELAELREELIAIEEPFGVMMG
jgi:hypothetical protein